MTDRPATASQAPSPKRSTSAVEVGVFRAIWHALRSTPLDYHPRVQKDGVVQTLDTRAMLIEMSEASTEWGSLRVSDTALALARQSLDEVKSQTEYQDQKATRLLTVTTFLTAFSGIIFTRFADAYPLSASPSLPWWQAGVVIISYGLFSLFILTALFGALVTFHATRTRFKYTDISEPAKETGNPKFPTSRLFYVPIVSVRPEAWMHSYTQRVEPQRPGSVLVLHPELDQRYFRDLVGETYLVAAKTADKLRYLGPAQSLLAGSLRFLFVWLALSAAATISIPRPPQSPRQVNIIQP